MESKQSISPQEVKEAIEKIQKNPTLFYDHILGCSYWDVQKLITESVFHNQRTTVRSCNASGKTYIAARIALAYLYAFEDSIVFTTSRTQLQVFNSLWREIRGAFGSSKVFLGGECLKGRLDISPNWYAIGTATDDPNNVRGIHAKSGRTLIIVDEAGGMHPAILDALEGNLTSNLVSLLYIGNPTSNSGRFHESHKSSIYKKFKITVFDTPNFIANNLKSVADLKKYQKLGDMGTLKIPYPQLVTPQWAWTCLHQWGEENPLFQSLVLAEFPSVTDGSLIKMNDILDAVDRKLVDNNPCFVSIGVDVARYGSDDSVITVLAGMKLEKLQWHNGKNLMETTGMVKQLYDTYNVDDNKVGITVDDTGLGGGVTDRLREQDLPVRAVNFGEKAHDGQYTNLKAQMFWNLRDVFNDGLISIIDEGKLIAHLSSVMYTYTSTGSLQIVSKETMKSKGLPSPDFADSLALSVWGAHRKHKESDFDPTKGKKENSDGNLLSQTF